MDFLSKMKTNADGTKDPFAKPNPLNEKGEASAAPKKKLLIPKKLVKKEEKEEVVEEVTEKVLETPKKMSPKKVSLKEEPLEIEEKEKVEEPKEEKTEETKEAKETEEIEEVEEPEEEVVETEEVEEKEEAEETKEPDKKKTKKAVKKEVELTDTDKVEEKAEDKKVTKDKANKSKSSKQRKEKQVNSPTLSYNEAVASIRSCYYDDNWESFQEEISKELNDIVIEDDMNPATLKNVISSLSKIRQKIWLPYQNVKTTYENLKNDKPEGLIERIKRVSFDESAKNDMDRRKSGIEACMNYIPPTDTSVVINLYDVLDATTEQYNFLKASMDSIQYKTNILITMNGAIKLEAQLLPGEV